MRCNSVSVPADSGLGAGCQLTTLFGNQAASIKIEKEVSAEPKKHGWLPLLTVLFLISYGLMTMLIVEQGQTIESQRLLIRDLFRDSQELSAVKKAQQQATLAPSTQTPSTRFPSTQTPSTQASTSQAPSSQAVPQNRTQNQAAKQKPFRMPSKPASDLVDDVRTLIAI